MLMLFRGPTLLHVPNPIGKCGSEVPRRPGMSGGKSCRKGSTARRTGGQEGRQQRPTCLLATPSPVALLYQSTNSRPQRVTRPPLLHLILGELPDQPLKPKLGWATSGARVARKRWLTDTAVAFRCATDTADPACNATASHSASFAWEHTMLRPHSTKRRHQQPSCGDGTHPRVAQSRTARRLSFPLAAWRKQAGYLNIQPREAVVRGPS